MRIMGTGDHIWKSVESLRGKLDSREEYNVILLLTVVFTLRPSKLSYEIHDFSYDILQELIVFDLFNRLKKIDGLSNDQASQLEEIFQPILERLDPGALFLAIENLMDPSKGLVLEKLPQFFDDALFTIARSQSKSAQEFIQPSYLTKFIISLVEVPNGGSIYDPFAGQASYGVYCESDCNYVGQEKDRFVWAIGILRLLAHGRIQRSGFYNENSMVRWNSVDIKHDLIISTPPIGSNVQEFGSEERPESVESFFIRKGIESLTDKGKLVGLFGTNILFGTPGRSLREQTVFDDLLDMVILIPPGELIHPGIGRQAVIVLNKDKPHPGFVRMVNASNYLKESGKKRVLDTEAVKAIIDQGQNDVHFRLVHNDEIAANDYSLNVPQYFMLDIPGGPLKGCVTNIHGTRLSEDGMKGIHVRIRDLSEDPNDILLNIDAIEESELRTMFRKIEEPCVLVATRWKTLKPTLFEYHDQPIFISNDIIALKVDAEKILPKFLVHLLYEDKVREQAEALRLGMAVPFLNWDDFLNIKVELPDIPTQRAHVNAQDEVSEKIHHYRAQIEALESGTNSSTINEFASLRHTLATPLHGILSTAETLLRFFEDQSTAEVQAVKALFQERYQRGLNGVIYGIRDKVDDISVVLRHGADGLKLTDYPITVVPYMDLYSMIMDIGDEDWNFKLTELLLDPDELNIAGLLHRRNYDPTVRGVHTNLDLLKILLKNILENANKHGFAEDQQNNEVVIEFQDANDHLIILIKNNGKPFPENFDRDKFIERYTTTDPNSGSGLGGYDINRIATYLGDPDWELDLTDPLFPVEFRFKFKLEITDVKWSK